MKKILLINLIIFNLILCLCHAQNLEYLEFHKTYYDFKGQIKDITSYQTNIKTGVNKFINKYSYNQQGYCTLDCTITFKIKYKYSNWDSTQRPLRVEQLNFPASFYKEKNIYNSIDTFDLDFDSIPNKLYKKSYYHSKITFIESIGKDNPHSPNDFPEKTFLNILNLDSLQKALPNQSIYNIIETDKQKDYFKFEHHKKWKLLKRIVFKPNKYINYITEDDSNVVRYYDDQNREVLVKNINFDSTHFKSCGIEQSYLQTKYLKDTTLIIYYKWRRSNKIDSLWFDKNNNLIKLKTSNPLNKTDLIYAFSTPFRDYERKFSLSTWQELCKHEYTSNPDFELVQYFYYDQFLNWTSSVIEFSNKEKFKITRKITYW